MSLILNGIEFNSCRIFSKKIHAFSSPDLRMMKSLRKEKATNWVRISYIAYLTTVGAAQSQEEINKITQRIV